MTESKHLKARIRARMARTGERYMTARRHVVGESAAAADDHGWRLRGGVHPDSAAIANVLAHDGAPVSEAMVLGVGGGLGAGYILWEFEAHGARTLVLGFRNQWQYPDRWARKVLERLGVPFALHETSGAKGAAARLDAAVARRPPGARDRRPRGGRLLAPAGLRVRPRRLPGRGVRDRGGPRAASTTATSRRCRSRASGSTRRAPASSPTSTGWS